MVVVFTLIATELTRNYGFLAELYARKYVFEYVFSYT